MVSGDSADRLGSRVERVNSAATLRRKNVEQMCHGSDEAKLLSSTHCSFVQNGMKMNITAGGDVSETVRSYVT